MQNAQQKADEWLQFKIYIGHPRGTRGPWPTLAVGTIVRATRLLDKGVTDIVSGTVGVVFGETNCYGDGAGPIVQWFTLPSESKNVGPVASIEEHFQKILQATKVCNIYPEDAEVLRVHDSVFVGHLDAYPDIGLLPAIKRLLHYSWRDIDYKHSGLTERERKAVSEEDFISLVEWIKHEFHDVG